MPIAIRRRHRVFAASRVAACTAALVLIAGAPATAAEPTPFETGSGERTSARVAPGQDAVAGDVSLARLLEATRVAPQTARSAERLRESLRAGLAAEVLAGQLERKRLPRIERLVDETYTSDVLLGSVEEALADGLRPGDAKALTAFALSPLGQRSLDEEDAYGEGDVETEIRRFAKRFGALPDHEPRLARAVEMERVLGFADVQSGFVVDMQRAVLGGLSLSLPPGARPELEGMLDDLEELRTTLPDQLRGLMTLHLAYMYRNLSLKEQDALIVHLATPAARRFSAVLVGGIGAGLQRASIAFGDRLGRSMSLATVDEEI